MSSDARTSVVWNYFTKIERDGKEFSKCHLCLFELSGHLAGNAKKHLGTRHGQEMLAEVRATEREQGRTVPNNAKNRIDELRAKKAALLNDVMILGSDPVELNDDDDEVGKVTHVRAARSNQLDPDKHKSQNKEATQRYRKRLAEEEELREAIKNLEAQKAAALGRRALVHAESSAMVVNRGVYNAEQIVAGPSVLAAPFSRKPTKWSLTRVETCGVQAADTRFSTSSNYSYHQPQEDLLTLAVSMNSRLHTMALEIVGMASARIGGIVVFNALRQPSYDTALVDIITSSPNASTNVNPYTYGILRSIFGDVSPENQGAAFISFFDEYTGAFDPKVYAHGVTLPKMTPEQPVYALPDWGRRHVAT